MAVLTQFVTSVSLRDGKETSIERFGDRLKAFENAFSVLKDEGVSFNASVIEGSGIKKAEERIFRDAWKDIGFIPSEVGSFDISRYNMHSLKGKNAYAGVLAYSNYPVTRLGALKELADKMGLVIVHNSYVDYGRQFDVYRNLDSRYYRLVRERYEEFQRVVNDVNVFLGDNQDGYQIYFVAPVSFYDLWLEVTSERVYPKFFSDKLATIRTTLDLLMPAQRNLYVMSKANEENIRVMKKNFVLMEKAIVGIHERLAWLEDTTRVLNRRIEELSMKFDAVQMRVYELEKTAAYLLDPIVFALPSGIDVASSKDDNAEVRIGLCFGPDMPLEVFVSTGMKELHDDFKEIECPYNMHLLDVCNVL